MTVLRMERAVALVLNRPQSLCDISAELGFAEPAHFMHFYPEPFRRQSAGVPQRVPSRHLTLQRNAK
jgi:AraC-like DNA-binding protein